MAKGGNKVSKTFAWILMGLLILGLGGFGATNLGGTIQTVGSVGEEKISVDEYARALQNELRNIEQQFGQPVSFQQAEAFGVPQRVLSRLILEKAYDSEAATVGISVSDEIVARELQGIQAFYGPDGTFNQDAYIFTLENANISVSEFEESVRKDVARGLMQNAILADDIDASVFSDTVNAFVNEERSFRLIRLSEADLTDPIGDPTDEDLVAFHAARSEQYQLPERKKITYIYQTPDMLIDTIDVEEDAILALYDDRKDEYFLPARRIVERLVYIDPAEAQQAYDALQAGTTTFEQLVTERGLDLADIDLGDVEIEDLRSAGEAVFALEVGQVSPPQDINLGPSLFRVNAVLNEQTVPLDEVRNALFDELALERARRVIEGEMDRVDNELAAGATLEDLAEEMGMTLATVEYFPTAEDPILAYPAFVEEAEAVNAGDFPQVKATSDGGMFALRMDEILSPSVRPVAEVKEDVERDWRVDQVTKALVKLASETSATIFETKSDAVENFENLTRNEFVAAAGENIVTKVFDATVGEQIQINGEDEIAFVVLDDISAGDTSSDEALATREQIYNGYASSVSNDLFSAFSQDLRSRLDIQIDEAALQAVHNNF
jgi:peptidyl-prolyl cis-trans isomerase D